jgi:hypothetical protein
VAGDEDETALSEITILPDGRVYVFGMSRQILELLETLLADEPRVRALLEQARAAETGNVPPGGPARKVD